MRKLTRRERGVFLKKVEILNGQVERMREGIGVCLTTPEDCIRTWELEAEKISRMLDKDEAKGFPMVCCVDCKECALYIDDMKNELIICDLTGDEVALPEDPGECDSFTKR